MHRFLLLATLYILLLTSIDCSHSTGPTNPQRKDPRTYTWTIDTVFFTFDPLHPSGQTIMREFWGASDTSVYAVGHDATYGYGCIWKFNGTRWERPKLLSTEGGPITRAYDCSSIKGFAENDIYVFGEHYTFVENKTVSKSMVLHFDGIRWTDIDLPSGGGELLVSGGFSPSLIYAGGIKGELFKYDGTRWTLETLTSTAHPSLPLVVGFLGKAGDNGLFISTYQHDDSRATDHYEFYHYKDKQKTVIDSSLNDPSWGGWGYWQSPNGTIYSCGSGGIFKYADNKWTNVYASEFISKISGVNESHIFAVNYECIFFYDGASWSVLRTTPSRNNVAYGVWCSETQVFITFTDGQKSYILHGK